MEQLNSLKTDKKFKKTEIGEIPVDWEVTELSDVISSYKNGIWGDDPTLNEKSYPIIRSTEITHDGKIDLSTVAFRKISEAQIKKYKLQDNDILLVASSGSPNLIGRSALFKQPYDKRIYLFSNFMIRIRPEKINHYFLFYFLNSQYYHNFLKFLQQTSTGLRNLPKREFIKMKLPFPSLHEQKKIAEILTTVDETIEKSDKVIEKIKELKKGLMQELLTRGIGHKKFKKTKIGEMPVDWQVVKLNKIGLLKGGSGFPEKHQGYVDKKYFFLKVSDMNLPENEIYINKATNTIDEEIREKIKCRVFLKNTIIFAKVGAALLLNKRRILTRESCIDNNMMGLIVNQKYDYKFYYYIMSTIDFAKYVFSGALPSVNQTVLGDIDVVCPFLVEQKKIAGILSTVDEDIEGEVDNKKKIETIKKGLMQVLLTGKVRVKGV